MEFATLKNDVKMPKLGFGVFMIPNDETERCVLDAMDVGYRLIDTKQAYSNEEGVGNAIPKCGLPGRNCSSPPRSGSATTDEELHSLHRMPLLHRSLPDGTRHSADDVHL